MVIDGLTITASGDDEVTGEPHSIEVRIEGDCTHATIDDETFDLCAGDTSSIPEVDEFLAESPAIDAFVDSLGRGTGRHRADRDRDAPVRRRVVRQPDGHLHRGDAGRVAGARPSGARRADRALSSRPPTSSSTSMFGGFGEYEEYPDDSFDDYSSDDYSRRLAAATRPTTTSDDLR